MWLPFLIEQGIVDEMQSMGSELSSRDIYNDDSVSLKDAVLLFGGGCTASFISHKGLILTNYHCARSYVSSLSSETEPYLLNGFWAKSAADEMKVAGLTVNSLKKVEDYTAYVDSLLPLVDYNELEKKLTDSISKLTQMHCELEPFWGKQKYYLITYKEYTDVRLVASVPESIGNYGGDEDNWMWPRHSADFSLFRVYEKDSAGNDVQVKPAKWLELDLTGIDEGQFTMVYGYPGQTQEYLPSPAIESIVFDNNPLFVDYRGEMLERIGRYMDISQEHQLRYCALSNRLSNYWKKLQGENWGISQANTINKKKNFEAQLMQKHPEVKALLDSSRVSASVYSNSYHELLHFFEGVFRLNMFSYINRFEKELKGHEQDPITEIVGCQLDRYNDYVRFNGLDIDLCYYEYMVEKYFDHSDGISKVFDKLEISPVDLLEKSFVYHPERFNKFMRKLKQQSEKPNAKLSMLDKFYADPFVRFVEEVKDIYRQEVLVDYRLARTRYLNANEKFGDWLYENGYMQYPDANGTMRFSFGTVNGYRPRDAVSYGWQTSVGGMLAKHQTDTSVYKLLPSFYQFLSDHVETENVPICFVASNHTSGGNSGSPVLNKKGQLIGLNFDRNWEGTMSDIDYDVSRCRNISVDVRFIVFTLKEYAGLQYLIDEMDLVEE